MEVTHVIDRVMETRTQYYAFFPPPPPPDMQNKLEKIFFRYLNAVTQAFYLISLEFGTLIFLIK